MYSERRSKMTTKNDIFSDAMISGVPWVIISKLMLFFVYFAISVMTVRFLGSSAYGTYVICKSIAEVFVLICTLGMTASYIRYIPELIINKNRAGMSRLILKAGGIQLIAFITASFLVLFNSYYFDSIFSTSFNGALIFTCGLVFFELLKTNINALLRILG